MRCATWRRVACWSRPRRTLPCSSRAGARCGRPPCRTAGAATPAAPSHPRPAHCARLSAGRTAGRDRWASQEVVARLLRGDARRGSPFRVGVSASNSNSSRRAWAKRVVHPARSPSRKMVKPSTYERALATRTRLIGGTNREATPRRRRITWMSARATRPLPSTKGWMVSRLTRAGPPPPRGRQRLCRPADRSQPRDASGREGRPTRMQRLVRP